MHTHQSSKESRKALYGFIEELLDRKMLEHEQINLSRLTKKAVKDQMAAVLQENERMRKSLTSMKYAGVKHIDKKTKRLRFKWKITKKIHKLKQLFRKTVNQARFRIDRAKKIGIRSLWDAGYIVDQARIRKNRARNLRNKRLYGNNYAKKAPCYRKRLIWRDGDKCFWCGKTLGVQDSTIDHIKPVSQGGPGQDLKNMRLIHDPCRVTRDTMIRKGLLKI